ncbi:MAG: rubrerythrin family protein [Actinomycetota bacterium]|jgi:rubrerythrin|nr:rubrerythrin family protein [Actinomycetota bacterium]MDD5668356.1 rubrerythrin family protein [Actinomycetota bacterium]
MREMTERFLNDAFAGESMAHMKYMLFADRAEQEGLTEMARMFRAIAYAELVHAGNHLDALGDLKSTSDNIQSCIEGETFEIDEMYPVYNAAAKLQDEAGAVRSTHYALEAEKIHADWYKKSKGAVDGGEDVKVGAIQICSVCGHTREGEAPDKCPICGASREKFRQF